VTLDADLSAYAQRFSTRPARKRTLPAHLQRLEAESIFVMREVAAGFENPVMLYSIGKDSSVMLHLAMKAFWPSRPPFPFMHIDTTWKFREMIEFRRIAGPGAAHLSKHPTIPGIRRQDNNKAGVP
jgi:sulfate adenylyltransferase subunit 2